MNRPPRRLLALVATVLVGTLVTVSAYLNGRAEVERLSQGAAGEPTVAPVLSEQGEVEPLPSIQVRLDGSPCAERRAG